MITLCMLVRDPDPDRLAALLQSLGPVVGQTILVVDDRTTADLSGYGEVVPFTWCDDFAAARNAALPFVKGDWVLTLDPDEMPSPEMIDFLRFVDASSWTDVDWVDRMHFAPRGYLFWRTGFPDTQECEWHCRLFRAGHGRWVRPVHELVELDGRLEGGLRETSKLPKAPRCCSFDHHSVHTPEKDELYERLTAKARVQGWEM